MGKTDSSGYGYRCKLQKDGKDTLQVKSHVEKNNFVVEVIKNNVSNVYSYPYKGERRSVMNFLWVVMILGSIAYALANGDVNIINDVFVNVGKDTFDFVIPLLCVTVFWNGVLYVAREAGIIHFVERLMHPLLNWLFPDLKHDEETLGYVATNCRC